MNIVVLVDGTIINLAHARSLIPYTDGSYRIFWLDGSILDLFGTDAQTLTVFLTGKVAIKRVLDRPQTPQGVGI